MGAAQQAVSYYILKLIWQILYVAEAVADLDTQQTNEPHQHIVFFWSLSNSWGKYLALLLLNVSLFTQLFFSFFVAESSCLLLLEIKFMRAVRLNHNGSVIVREIKRYVRRVVQGGGQSKVLMSEPSNPTLKWGETTTIIKKRGEMRYWLKKQGWKC